MKLSDKGVACLNGIVLRAVVVVMMVMISLGNMACAGKSEAEAPSLVRIEEVMLITVTKDGSLYAHVPEGKMYVRLMLDPEVVTPYIEIERKLYQVLKEQGWSTYSAPTLYVRDRGQLRDLCIQCVEN